MPHWTRPLERTSTVATFSATRAGWMKPKGVRVTPKPMPICSVRWDRAPSTTSERRAVRATLAEVVLHHPDGVEAELVGEGDLLHGLVVGPLLVLPLGVGVRLVPPRRGDVDLVEQVELHGGLLFACFCKRLIAVVNQPYPRRRPVVQATVVAVRRLAASLLAVALVPRRGVAAGTAASVDAAPAPEATGNGCGIGRARRAPGSTPSASTGHEPQLPADRPPGLHGRRAGPAGRRPARRGLQRASRSSC